MQVKPWITSQPSCSLLVTDCYEFNISGAKDEVVNLWRGFVIRHCSHLEVPALLQEFSSLNVLKLYNSTIKSWEESATISQKYHPDLNMLYLVRVTMVNGELPVGLLGGDFPEMLRDIEFCYTNLRTLPDDFDLKWPKFASIYFEACEFTEVPASLARLAPIDLSLASNPISSIPAVGFLHIGSTLISELPQLVSDVSPSMVLRVDNTNISFFWDWMDTVVASIDSMLPPPILATNSPYCSDLQKIYAGKKTRFSAPLREGQSLLLSNASVENWPVLQAAVSCILWPSTWFPLDFEDGYSGIKTE
ncbi:unnamed protein product [Phytophthora lilii]|uniref:Unnamed protein product n=1 Tax=Phytophthora lilii TaxID=2077276 RepID=A0A9W6TL40_9STRA|nr:unnamed protein product [Phytophthora lilii]